MKNIEERLFEMNAKNNSESLTGIFPSIKLEEQFLSNFTPLKKAIQLSRTYDLIYNDKCSLSIRQIWCFRLSTNIARRELFTS